MKVGLVLGRFQPLHGGHLQLIEQAFSENDEVVVCIGSAQRAEPRPIEVRHAQLDRLLGERHPDRPWRIVDLIDPEPMETWPEYVKEVCQLRDEDENIFYRSDPLEPEWVARLEAIGFTVKITPRVSFDYAGPDGQLYSLSSATEIKELHAEHGWDLS